MEVARAGETPTARLGDQLIDFLTSHGCQPLPLVVRQLLFEEGRCGLGRQKREESRAGGRTGERENGPNTQTGRDGCVGAEPTDDGGTVVGPHRQGNGLPRFLA